MQLAQSLDPGLLKGAFVVGDPYMVRLAFIFSLGMLFYLYRDKVIVSGPLAILALVVFVVSLKTQSYYGIGEVMWAYLCIWASVRLPFHHADRFGDFSYGLYIYAFVVQQMLALYGVNAWGFIPYVVLSAVGTMVLAAASWFAVERPCLRLKSLRVPWRRATKRVDEASPFLKQPSRLGSKSSTLSRTVSLDNADPSALRDLPSHGADVSAQQPARAEDSVL
jgi:peptidoglycan/LPS O-acetylase OafA/YrhL